MKDEKMEKKEYKQVFQYILLRTHPIRFSHREKREKKRIRPLLYKNLLLAF